MGAKQGDSGVVSSLSHFATISNTQQDKADLQRRIRGLTTLLHRFAVQKTPSKLCLWHPFLRHFTTLLTCNNEYDTEAQRVIAVTGSIDPGQPVRILVAAQDMNVPSSAPPIFLQRIVQKRHRSLDEVVAGHYSHGFELITIY